MKQLLELVLEFLVLDFLVLECVVGRVGIFFFLRVGFWVSGFLGLWDFGIF
jgi:hypothetical protein